MGRLFIFLPRFTKPVTLYYFVPLPPPLAHKKALDLRMKGAMTGEGANFDYKNLFYLSVHLMDTKSGVQYARMRIARELLDNWLSKKISLNGKKYDDSSVSLTDKD